MNPTKSPLPPSRQTMAVGIWTLLLISMALIRLDSDSPFTIAIQIVVSIVSCIALSLFGQIQTRGSIPDSSLRITPFGISVAIPILWALHLSSAQSVTSFVTFAIIGLTPVCVTGLTGAPSRTALNALEFRKKTDVLVQEQEQIAPQTAAPQTVTEAALHTVIDNNDEEEEDGGECPIESVMRIGFESPPSPASHLTQWLKRSLSGNCETIEGGLCVNFEPGQRDTTVHVSFCPPFHAVPEVTAEALDVAELEIRVAAVFPFGARLQVRRRNLASSNSEHSLAETCRIGFVAIAARERRAA